jgi:hypothetical protein
MIRRSITRDNACLLVARWLFERRQDRAPHVGDGQPRA